MVLPVKPTDCTKEGYLEKRHHGLGFFPHIQPLVLVLFHKLEVLQGLDCKYVLLALLGHLK